MSLDHCLLDALRVALVLGGAMAAMPLLRRASAAARRLVLVLALGGVLALPAVSALAPAWRVGARTSVVALAGEPFREPLSEAGPPVAVPRAEAGATARPAAARPWIAVDPRGALAALWVLGALVVVARLGAGVLRARGLVRRAVPAPSWSRAVARAEQITGLRADVRITLELDAPAVAGVLAPVVLVPRDGESWGDERRVAVLLHELAHVRQQDCLAQIAAQIACALHWFDPLVWIAARRLHLERELAADDAVLAAGARPSRYAEDLLAIAGVRAVPAGALGMAARSELAARVLAIVSARRERRPVSRPRAALLVAGAAAVLLAVACATPEASAPAQSTPAPPTPAPSTPTASAPAGTSAYGAAGATIDPRLQGIADEELDRAVAEWQPAAGVIVVLDPATGAILANAGWTGGAHADVAVTRAYLTGSTLKPITLAAALEEGVVATTDRFDAEQGARAYGARTLRDASPYGTLTVPEMLAVSSNIAFAKVFDRLGGERLERWLRRFHFGAAPALAGAAAGELPVHVEDRSFEGAVLAIGEAMRVSPVQLAAAYAAFANEGVYVAPTLSARAGSPPREALLRPETARAIVSLLEEAVGGERSTGKLARIAGVRVAGKTGTAEWPAPGGDKVYASFVGIVPADRPRFVVLVGVESPRGNEGGGKVAAPVFARVAARALGG